MPNSIRAIVDGKFVFQRPHSVSQGAVQVAGTGKKRPASDSSFAGKNTGKYARTSSSSKECSTDVWTDRFSPRTAQDIVGNNSAVSTLRTWLLNWNSETPGKGTKVPTRRAVLISGPPGIGKTSSATLVCEELGLRTLSVNASDSRGKSGDISDGIAGSLSSKVREFVTNSSIQLLGERGQMKSVLIMDEVDGMAGGDRGGITELIQLIKITRIPIICICNDRYSQKLKTLANYCMDLPFQRPNKLQVRKLLLDIASSQSLNIDVNAIESLIEISNNDLRSCINQLQLWSMGSTVADATMKMKKDVTTSIFQAVTTLFSNDLQQSIDIDQKLALVFQHGDLLPFFIQENYPFMRPANSRSDLHRLVHTATAASRISEGDIFTTAINKTQNWAILPVTNIMSSIVPSSIMKGSREMFGDGERNFHRFPGLLGKLSSKSKSHRLLSELHKHILSSSSYRVTATEFRLRYSHLVKRQVTEPMFSESRGGKEAKGIPDVLEFMNAYNLTKDDWGTIQDITALSGKGPMFHHPNKQIPSSVKSAFTKACKRGLG